MNQVNEFTVTEIFFFLDCVVFEVKKVTEKLISKAQISSKQLL